MNRLILASALGLFATEPALAGQRTLSEADASRSLSAVDASTALSTSGSLSAAEGSDQTAEDDDDDEQQQADLMALLAEETDLATRTRQNADFVPGLVSVLHGSDLMALGKRTVLDALALVPGIETNRDQGGAATLRVRGMDFFFNSGNVKVLVDGLDLAAETSSFNSGVLLMPITQVERIEVIRGPGSNLHGDFAFTGLVNIITRQQDGRLALGLGEGSARTGTLSFGQQGDWDIGGNLSNTSSERYDGPDDAPVSEDRSYANAHIAHAGFSLKTAALKRRNQRLPPPPPASPPPPGGSPPPPPGRGLLKRERISTTELRYDRELGGERRLGLGFTHQDARNAEQVNSFEGGYDQLSADGVWRLGAHLLVFEAQVARLDIDRANSMAAQGAPASNTIAPFSDHRNYQSLLLQDQLDLSDRLTLTAGLRHDTLEGVDARLTPRLALVWRVNDTHTLKAQYAEGFRTPTFVELFSRRDGANPDLDFEAIDSLELSYLYRRGDLSVRATAFSQSVDNLILRSPMPQLGHVNAGAVRVDGVELEWNQPITSWLRMISSLTLVDSDDTRGAPQGRRTDSFGEARVTGNLSLLARPNERWTAGVHWNHLGNRAAAESPDVPGYDRVDLALTRHLRHDIDVSISLRNALDDDILYIGRVPPGRVLLNDYSGRLLAVDLVWDF